MQNIQKRELEFKAILDRLFEDYYTMSAAEYMALTREAEKAYAAWLDEISRGVEAA